MINMVFDELPTEGTELNQIFQRLDELENQINNQQQVPDLSIDTGRTSIESFDSVNTGLSTLFTLEPVDQEITKLLTPAGEIPAVKTNAVVTHATDNPLNLYYLENPTHDGQIKIVHPENGKSLNINPGGHFANASTITVDDGFFTLMLWSEENGNKWLPLQTAAGGGDNLGNHTATQALKMKDFAIFLDTAENQSIIALALANNYVVPTGGAHDFFVNNLVTPKFGITETSVESNVNLIMNSADIREVDRLQFVQDAGALIAVGNPTIYVDSIGAGDLVINNVDTEAIIHSFSNKVGLQSTESTLQKQATNLLPRINIYKNAIPSTGTAYAESIYYFDRTTGGKTTGAVITAIAEDTGNTTYEGGLAFQIMQAGSQNIFLRMNEAKNNKIVSFRDIDLNGTNDLLGVDNIDFDGASSTIEGLHNLQFAQTSHSINSLSGELDYQVAATDFHRFIAGGTEIARFTEVTAGVYRLNMADHTIDDTKDIRFDPSATYAGAGATPTIGYDNASDELRFNAPNLAKHVWQTNNSELMGLTASQLTFADGLKIQANPNGTNPGLSVGSNAGDPASTTNGDLWYNSSTNKLRTKENGSNTDVVGAGGGGGDNIAEGDSKVEVIDTGTGRVDIFIDSLATAKYSFDTADFSPVVAGGVNLGTSLLPWGKFNVKDIEIETGGSLTINKNNIVSDAGGTIINVPTGDELTFAINGVDNINFAEDEIRFASGRAHTITAGGTSLSINSENSGDSIDLFTGAGRSFATIEVEDFLTRLNTKSTTDTSPYDLRFNFRHTAPEGLSDPNIGNISWEGNDSLDNLTTYVQIQAGIDDATNASEDGFFEVWVASNGTIAKVLDIDASGGSVRMGFYGTAAIAKQTGVAVSAAGIHAALVSLGLIT